jgi:transposase InsO family protein
VNAHKNARTTPYIRELMAVRRREGWSADEIAEAAGVSARTVYKWLARASAENRSSRAARIANRLSAPMIAKIVALRRERMTGAAIARRLRLPRSTVAGWLSRLGMGRLKLMEPKPPVIRYERDRAGELIHVDTKKLGRFKRVGHRISGLHQNRPRTRGAGFDAVHVAIDDATRLAYVEILPDESAAAATGFIERAIDWYGAQHIRVERIMSDNGSAYISGCFAAALQQRGLKHLRTRPYTPKTNGKAERFIQTLLREWAYAKAYCSSNRRNAALAAFLHRYNRKRPHASLAGRTPVEALQLKR